MAIEVRALGKQFSRHHAGRPRTLKETLLRGPRPLKRAERFWALKDVSFAVAPGEMLGVIGPNGTGKSTLLQLLGGVIRPDEGEVRVAGRIGGLLDLGTGFHPDLTGRENVVINGVVAGLSRREIRARFDSIVAFAELEHAVDSPLRTFSSGMKMRLGFAVAVHTDPSVLLIDEVLSVGDLAFAQKCLARIEAVKRNGCAIVLVSHDLAQVRERCEQTLWLRAGRVVARGPSEAIVAQYTSEMSAETRRRTPEAPDVVTPSGTSLKVGETRFGSLEMEITEVRLCDAKGQPCEELPSGEGLSVEIAYFAPEPVEAPIFGVSISSDARQDFFDTSTDSEGIVLPRLHGEGKIFLRFERLDLSGGDYYLNVGVYEKSWAHAYDYHWHVYPLKVTAPPSKGALAPPRRWEFSLEALSGTPSRS